MRKNPCEKDCPYRSPECHPVCEKYLIWKKEREEILARIQQDTRIWISDRYRNTQRYHKNHYNNK